MLQILQKYKGNEKLAQLYKDAYTRIVSISPGMLKTSLDAKVAKLDKKLKMVELQLKKEKITLYKVKFNYM